jgi:hypothetical protein
MMSHPMDTVLLTAWVFHPLIAKATHSHPGKPMRITILSTPPLPMFLGWDPLQAFPRLALLQFMYPQFTTPPFAIARPP